jgi:hypothetical protein
MVWKNGDSGIIIKRKITVDGRLDDVMQNSRLNIMLVSRLIKIVI